jgi:hypothetical protein
MPDTVETLFTAAGQDGQAGSPFPAGGGTAGPVSSSRPARPFLTAERARELFAYDPSTGILTNRVKRSSRGRVGVAVGSINGRGQLVATVNGRHSYVHRIIWLVVHGSWPEAEIDHVDGNPTNNRLANLRPASRGENMQNKVSARGSSSKFLGVSWADGRK